MVTWCSLDLPLVTYLSWMADRQRILQCSDMSVCYFIIIVLSLTVEILGQVILRYSFYSHHVVFHWCSVEG